MPLFCPVTRAVVYAEPAWINHHASSSFTSNFWVVNDSIVYSSPSGRGTLDAVQNSLSLNRQVADFVIAKSGEYIQIEDYAHLMGSTAAARRYFVKSMIDSERMSTLIFCNLSPTSSIAVNIGRRFNTTSKEVHVVKRYSDAIALALRLSGNGGRPTSAAPIDLRNYRDRSNSSLTPVDVRSDRSWDVCTPEYKSQAVVIDNAILHASPAGFLDAKHLPLIERFRTKCITSLPEEASIQYIVVDNSKLIGGSRAARIEYVKSLVRWHQRFPFRMYIGYGANNFVKTASLLAKPLVPFKIRLARDLRHAFRIVRDDQRGKSSHERHDRNKQHVIQQADIEKVMAIIGGVDWASQGFDNSVAIDSGNPLFYLYQSIKLIKEELDELFVEREQFQSDLYQARKMESVGTIAAGIAHDFNNTLGMISGNTDLALAEVETDNPVRAYLEAIRSATRNAEGVVKQLLNFSRKSEQDFSLIDAVPIIEETIELLQATLPESIDLSGVYGHKSIKISSDATQIKQILMNLVTNAAQAMEETGGTVEVGVAKVLATYDLADNYPNRKAGNCLRITVSDDGPGIKPDHMDRIFDPYFTTKSVDKGSGMGLSIVHGIAKDHGGTVNVASRPGNGSTFTVLLPISAQQPPLLPKPLHDRPFGDESVLFVEDEEAIVKLMRKTLEQFGYELEACLDPMDALEMFRANPARFDIVITDMTMPQMDGIELASRLKEIRADIPIVIFTGYSLLIDMERAQALGIDAVAFKPTDMRNMGNIIRRVISGKDRSSSAPPDAA